MQKLKTIHFLTGEEVNQHELSELLKFALALKKERGSIEPQVLTGKTVALIFEKPSLRTRVSFAVGVQELGGHVLDLVQAQTKAEDPEDAIRVLQGMVHGVMLRTFAHEVLERMVTHAKIPVINGLSNDHHPCQALADLLTLQERFGHLRGLRLAYVGDGNNVLHSLLLLAPFLGVDIHYACPAGHQPNDEILQRARVRALQGGAQIRSFANPKAAVSGVHAIYTDVWASMGFEKEAETHGEDFSGYQVNVELLGHAAPTAIVMHCLPMLKGSEITQEIVDHPRSALFDQAANRLHAQKALMVGLFRSNTRDDHDAQNVQNAQKRKVHVDKTHLGRSTKIAASSKTP